jgi:hypothetical protein
MEPDNVEQLVQTIMKLTQNKVIQQSLTNEAKIKVEQEFSLLVNAQRLNVLFQTTTRVN